MFGPGKVLEKSWNFVTESLWEPCNNNNNYARFFYPGSHLPGYLVASFIKRIARLALSAPPGGARLCIVFVANLMVRHPSCCVLAHRPDCTLDQDPFRLDQEDPAKTRAMDSSLWEIKVKSSFHSQFSWMKGPATDTRKCAVLKKKKKSSFFFFLFKREREMGMPEKDLVKVQNVNFLQGKKLF